MVFPWVFRPKSFSEFAKAAFPPGCERIAYQAESDLKLFVDHAYRTAPKEIIVDGSCTYIPYRLHFADAVIAKTGYLSPGAQCLLTRATNGYIRQEAAKAIIGWNRPWSIPFIVLLLGEYVSEIADDIHRELDRLNQPAYSAFVLQNRPVMKTLRAKATSYWNTYYRQSYPQKHSYPALAVLRRLEEWAS